MVKKLAFPFTLMGCTTTRCKLSLWSPNLIAMILYELLGGRRHDDLHLRTAFAQAARQFGALVGRDTAGHPEQNAFALHDLIIGLLTHARTI